MKNDDTTLPSIKIGQDADASERLVEKIQQTGVVESQDAANAMPAPDQMMTDGTEPPSIPSPLITRA